MMNKGFFIFVAFTALAFASEVEDVEQKKKGTGKSNNLNSIPTGVQKLDYTYNTYSQNSNPLSGPSQSYQNSVPNSFYPSQLPSQHYKSTNSADSSTPFSSYSPQNSQSHFLPINFIPITGYQMRYQMMSQKPNGNLIVIPTPAIHPAHTMQYTNPFYNNPNSHIAQGSILGPLTHGPFSFAHNYHPLTLSSSYISQPAMVVIPQNHNSLYNNMIYPNGGSSLHSYYPSNSQIKYPSVSVPVHPNEYEKVHASISHSVSKEGNGIVQNSEYASSSNSNSAYNGNAYSKI